MADDKQHIDIDLDFLDRKSSPQREEKSGGYQEKTPHKRPGKKLSEYNWKKILLIGGVILFFGWIIFSEDNSTSNTNTGSYTPSSATQMSPNNDSVVIGEYTCSRYHYNQAVALDPDESEAQITAAENALEYRANELERLQSEIESSYVNEYSSQYKINQYNAMVDEYNSKLFSYKRDAISLDSRIDKYNAQIAKHNNYLKNNCTPNR